MHNIVATYTFAKWSILKVVKIYQFQWCILSISSCNKHPVERMQLCIHVGKTKDAHFGYVLEPSFLCSPNWLFRISSRASVLPCGIEDPSLPNTFSFILKYKVRISRRVQLARKMKINICSQLYKLARAIPYSALFLRGKFSRIGLIQHFQGEFFYEFPRALSAY